MQVQILEFGLGKIISQWEIGPNNTGQVRLFISKTSSGVIGELVSTQEIQEAEQSIILRFYSREGANILLEDINSALDRMENK